MSARAPLAATNGVLAVAYVFFAMIGTARAHGPAPAPLEVLEVDATGGPTSIRTNIGIARANGDGTFSFGCPSRVGTAAELALAAGQGDLVVTLADTLDRESDRRRRVVRISRGGCVIHDVDHGTLRPEGLATVDDRVFLLGSGSAGGELHEILLAAGQLSPAAAPLGWPIDAIDGIDTAAGGPALVASGALPRPFVIVYDVSDAEIVERARFVGAIDGASSVERLVPRTVDGDAVLLVATTAAGRRFVARADPSLGILRRQSSDANAIHGPIPLGAPGILVAAIDGEAVVIRDGIEWRWLGVVDWTCLDHRRGHAFACSLSGLVRLEPEGFAGDDAPQETLAFTFSQLGPSTPCPSESPAETQLCQLDWLHFGGEAGLLDAPPARAPGAPRGSTPTVEPAACTVSHGAPGWRALPSVPLWAALFVLCALRGGRRRERPRSLTYASLRPRA
jgi:hypothetical protein